MELGRVRSGIPTQTFATPSRRYTFQNSDLAQYVRRIPSSLFHVDESVSLGEGSFGKCIKGYMQGIEVCLKQIKSSPGVTAKTSLLREASILSKLCHQTVCFLHGVQCEKEPYYLVTNLYVIDGFSITIYDFLCLSAKDDSSKRCLVKLLHSDVTMRSWCLIMTDVAHGLHYIHCDHQIIHRDLKSNNIVLCRQNNDLKPVIIDFGKSVQAHKAMRYKLTESEKQQYLLIHKHIAPDLIDGVCVPSPASDMYSYGRIFKNIVCYSQTKSGTLSVPVRTLIKNCLKYHSTDRPTAADAIDILCEHCSMP